MNTFVLIIVVAVVSLIVTGFVINAKDAAKKRKAIKQVKQSIKTI